MGKYIRKRLLQLIPILLAITLLSFAMMRAAGSDVVTQKMENTGSVVSEEMLAAGRYGKKLCDRKTRVYYIYIKTAGNTFAYGNFNIAYNCHINSVGSTCGSTTEQRYGLCNPVFKLYWKQYAELLCGTFINVSVCHQKKYFSGDIERYFSQKCSIAGNYASNRHVCKIFKTGACHGFGGAK